MRTIGKHLTRIALVLLLGGFVAATLVRFAPGFGVDEEDLDSRLNKASHASLRSAQANMGLFEFYADYWKRVAHGDLGVSVALNEPVRQLLAERIPDTAKSMGVGLTVAWTFGLGLALLSVLPLTRFVGWGAWLLSCALLCIPAAALALLFVLVQAPARSAVGLIVFPKIFQFTRNLLRRSAELPHVLTARAKGLSERRILLWHVLPVCAGQICALAGVSVCMALAASIPVEVLCDLAGIGQLAWKAALSRDLALLVDLTMLVTLVTLVANTGAEIAAQTMNRREA